MADRPHIPHQNRRVNLHCKLIRLEITLAPSFLPKSKILDGGKEWNIFISPSAAIVPQSPPSNRTSGRVLLSIPIPISHLISIHPHFGRAELFQPKWWSSKPSLPFPSFPRRLSINRLYCSAAHFLPFPPHFYSFIFINGAAKIDAQP